MTDAVAVSELVKRYRPNMPDAVAGVSFTVRPGEVFGLLGPNGAGKSTTIGVLTTRIRPTSGRAMVHGIDVAAESSKARKLLAVVSQRNNLDRSLSVRQNLLYHAAYHGVSRTVRNPRADEILEHMGLSDRAKSKVDELSGGQAQRVMIARSLMHAPKVLFLDEPSAGLDPQSRLFVHEKVSTLREEGVTVVLTTHDMDEAAKLCDRVGIVDHGKLLALETPEALTRGLPGSATLTLTVRPGANSPGTIVAALTDLDDIERIEQIGASPAADENPQLRLFTASQSATILPFVLKVLGDLDCEVTDLAVGKPSLEDVFIHMTGRELR